METYKLKQQIKREKPNRKWIKDEIIKIPNYLENSRQLEVKKF